MKFKSHLLVANLVGAMTLSLGACNQTSDSAERIASNTVNDSAQQNPEGPPAGGAMGPPPGGAGMGPPPGGMGGPPSEISDLIPSSKVTYKTVEGAGLQLHVFNPEGHAAGDNRPVMIFYPGGGFRFADPQSGYDLSEALNPKGVVLMAAEYRIVDTDGRTIDHIMSDAKSTVRYVRSHAKELGINPNQIVTAGHSAGAYLAATTGMIDGFDEQGEDTSISSMSNAMVLWSMGSARSERNTGNIIGEGRTLADYQPRKYLDSDLPPSIFIHGDVDTLIAPAPTVEFMEEVKAAGNTTRFVMVEGADHFFREEQQRMAAKTAIVEFFTSLAFIKP